MAEDSQRVLVVAGAAVDQGELGRQLDLEDDAELKVVAPIEPGSDLDLVAGDVDESIATAEQRAADAAAELEGATEAEVVEAESGEANPLLAIEDALATFQATQIVLLADAGDEAAWSRPDLAEEIRDNFGLPVHELRH
jgi:hypothetical protein